MHGLGTREPCRGLTRWVTFELGRSDGRSIASANGSHQQMDFGLERDERPLSRNWMFASWMCATRVMVEWFDLDYGPIDFARAS